MIKDVFNAIASAARSLFQGWRVLLILLALYVVMLGSVYLFFATREATVGQLLYTLALGILALVLWLVIQTMAVGYASEDRLGTLLARSFSNFWKLGVIALPLVFLVGLAVYYLGSVEFKSAQETVRSLPAPRRVVGNPPASPEWAAVALTTLQYLLMCFVLPLASMHLWIQAARHGLKNAFTKFARTLALAFAPRSVLTYAVGFVVFAVIPYLLVTRRTPVASPWLDVSLLGTRLAFAVLLSLIGWVVAVGALARLSGETAAAQQPDNGSEIPGTEYVPAET